MMGRRLRAAAGGNDSDPEVRVTPLASSSRTSIVTSIVRCRAKLAAAASAAALLLGIAFVLIRELASGRPMR